jgi:hypothetical protein
LPVPEASAGEVRRAAAEVLAREQYAELRPTVIDRFWSAVMDVFGRLIDLVGRTGQGGLIGTVLLLGVLALLIFLAVRLLRRVRGGGGLVEAPVGLAGRSAGDWAEEARRHESAGRWREAVRCHHRALVAQLAAEGLVEEMPGRTAAEYEAEAVVSVPGAADAMRSATRRFEHAWYANDPVGADDVRALLEAAGQVRRASGLGDRVGRA